MIIEANRKKGIWFSICFIALFRYMQYRLPISMVKLPAIDRGGISLHSNRISLSEQKSRCIMWLSCCKQSMRLTEYLDNLTPFSSDLHNRDGMPNAIAQTCSGTIWRKYIKGFVFRHGSFNSALIKLCKMKLFFFLRLIPFWLSMEFFSFF